MGVGQFQLKYYYRHQQKSVTLPWQCGFSGGGKKEYGKSRTKARGVSFGDIEFTTVAVTHDLLSGMSLVH